MTATTAALLKVRTAMRFRGQLGMATHDEATAEQAAALRPVGNNLYPRLERLGLIKHQTGGFVLTDAGRARLAP